MINNASTDGTKEYLESINNEKFLIVNEQTNLGGAGGFYEGIKIASQTKNDWILVIDDDAMISSDYIELINKCHELDTDVMAFSGTVKTDGKIITEHRRRMITSKCVGEVHVAESEYTNETFAYDLSTFCGLVIKRNVIDMIGLPRLDFFIQYDDTEYSMRIRKLTKIVNVNTAILNHKTTLITENKKVREKWNWKIYYGTRNKIYSCIKHGYKLIIANYIIRVLGGAIKDFINPHIPKEVSKYNIRMIWSAVRCGMIGNLGKDNRYLP